MEDAEDRDEDSTSPATSPLEDWLTTGRRDVERWLAGEEL